MAALSCDNLPGLTAESIVECAAMPPLYINLGMPDANPNISTSIYMTFNDGIRFAITLPEVLGRSCRQQQPRP